MDAKSPDAEPTDKRLMRAATYSQYGPIDEVISISELDIPEPEPDQVLVRVHAAAVNPGDHHAITGKIAMLMSVPFPSIPGMDFSGTIVKLGTNVDTSKWHVGDAVLGETDFQQMYGTFAEYTVCPTERIHHKPENISFMEAGGTATAFSTAYEALTVATQVEEGSNVMVLGGSSATGMVGIQLAKHFGAKFIGTTSRNPDICRELGADVVVNYREQDWTEELKDTQFDVILDCVGGEWENALRIMPGTCRFVSLVGPKPTDDPVGVGYMLSLVASMINRSFWALFGYPSFTLLAKMGHADFPAIVPLLADGFVRVIVDPRSPYALDSVHEMFRDWKAGSCGKLVMELVQE